MKPSQPNSLGVARFGLVVAASVVGAVLVISALLSLGAVKRSTEDLITGQATALIDELQASLREEGLPPTVDALTSWFEDARLRGVTFAGLGGELGIQVGVPAATVLPPMPLDEPFVVRRVEGKIRAERQRPRDSRPGRSGRSHWNKSGRVALGHIIIEFVPLTANELISRANRSVYISMAIAMVLVFASGLAYRWLGKRALLDQAQAARAHLAHLGEMSAVIAHELRNPLASLKGNAELLAETSTDERAKQKAERIVGEARRIEQLTTDLLVFAKTGAVTPTMTDPVALARSAAASVDASRIDLELGNSPANWTLDEVAMRQVLVNLLQNAIDASPADATVTLAVSAQQGQLSYTVRDRGEGIAKERLGDLFEPFVTTRTRGTGLGLAVARRLVQAHGGNIQASNHADGGALFVVTLPQVGERGGQS